MTAATRGTAAAALRRDAALVPGATAVATARDISMRFAGAAGFALKHVSLDIPAGHITGIVGPDAAGKTTLLRILAGLLTPSAGAATVLGQDARTRDKRVGYMPQKFGLYEELTVLENLTLYANLKDIHGTARRQLFERLLGFTGLERFTARFAGKLSGGMKQKLGLACTLLGKPRLLLLDEASVGVDPVSRRELWKIVRQLAGEGTAIVWSTSYLDEAEACANVLLLNAGSALFTGAPQQLHARVAQRVFFLREAGVSPRVTLRNARKDSASLDGVIQGHAVRLIARPGATLAPWDFGVAQGAHIQNAAPRFEDGFVDLLGGAVHADSTLTHASKSRPRDGKAMVETHNLSKAFGDFLAADAINLQVHRGEVVGLLGPNGAGKSTTFKMLCGLIAPTSGAAHIAGVNLRKQRSHVRQHLGYMAQKFSLYGHLSTLHNLQFFAGVYAMRGKKMKQAIQHVVDAFELTPYLKHPAGELPLGLKQRLSLACAILHSPDILFLDEPTSGVDPLTRREFWMHIDGLVAHGVTVLVTTHFMDEAEYCDRIALMNYGKIVAEGTPDALKAQAVTQALVEPTMEDAFMHFVSEAR